MEDAAPQRTEVALITATAEVETARHGERAKCLQRLIRLGLPVPLTVALPFDTVRAVAKGAVLDMGALLAPFGPAPLLTVRPSSLDPDWGGPGTVLLVGMNEARRTALARGVGEGGGGRPRAALRRDLRDAGGPPRPRRAGRGLPGPGARRLRGRDRRALPSGSRAPAHGRGALDGPRLGGHLGAAPAPSARRARGGRARPRRPGDGARGRPRRERRGHGAVRGPGDGRARGDRPLLAAVLGRREPARPRGALPGARSARGFARGALPPGDGGAACPWRGLPRPAPRGDGDRVRAQRRAALGARRGARAPLLGAPRCASPCRSPRTG